MHVEPGLLSQARLDEIEAHHCGPQTPSSQVAASLLGHIKALVIEHDKLIAKMLAAGREALRDEPNAIPPSLPPSLSRATLRKTPPEGQPHEKA